jgi:hypothetical protein
VDVKGLHDQIVGGLSTLIFAPNRKVATIVTGRGQSESTLKETSKDGRTVPVNIFYI